MSVAVADATSTTSEEVRESAPARTGALPEVGEWVTVLSSPGAGGESATRGYWIGTVEEVPPGAASARVRLLLTDGSLVERQVALDAITPDPSAGRLEGPLGQAVHALADVCAAMRGQRERHETWRRQFNEAATDRADSLDLCSQFDEFMEDWGLEGRARTYRCTVAVDASVYVTVAARTGGDAESMIDTEMVRDALLSSPINYEVIDTDRDD